jgi:hypothetical protein
MRGSFAALRMTTKTENGDNKCNDNYRNRFLAALGMTDRKAKA